MQRSRAPVTLDLVRWGRKFRAAGRPVRVIFLRMKRLLWALVFGAWSCGGDGTGIEVRSLAVRPAVHLAVGIGDTVRFRATVTDAARAPVTDVEVRWSVADTAVAHVDAAGLVTARAAGATTVSATADGVSDSAGLEVWIPGEVSAYVPGESYFGRRSYVEYVPGELPVILSAPHGGDLVPDEIPDRTSGTLATDRLTIQTALAVRDAFVERTGRAPHLVLSHLKRIKLDPNREVVEAAAGSPFAELAWRQFHEYIEIARADVAERCGSGLYIDLHGHAHAVARAELGYLLSAATLERSDAELDVGAYAASSSIRDAAERSPATFSELLRGPSSLGGALAARGVAAVPSPGDPSPGADPYFTGGYATRRHGSRDPGRVVSGIQIELPYPGVRESDAGRRAFAEALAAAVAEVMTEHWGFFDAPCPTKR